MHRSRTRGKKARAAARPGSDGNSVTVQRPAGKTDEGRPISTLQPSELLPDTHHARARMRVRA